LSSYNICYADGSPNKIAYIINGVPTIEERIFTNTSVESEWYSLQRTLENLNNYDNYIIYMDCMVVVKQFNGEYRVNAQNLLPFYNRCKKIVGERGLNVYVKWIPRKKNKAGWLLEK